MIPSSGRIVHYTLTAEDAVQINRRRHDAEVNESVGNTGFILHVGNPVKAGDVFPMMITRTWIDKVDYPVNGQVTLDGNDSIWVTNSTQGKGEGQYFTPPRIQ